MINLPPGCAVHRAEDPDARAGWGNTEELLATIAEVIDRHDRHYVKAHTKKGARQPKPIVITRPRELAKRKSRRNATGEELAKIVKRAGGALAKGG